MSKQYNLNKSKEAKGYYIDITRPYEQVIQDIIKLNPNAANKKYIINGTGNHSLQEWVENHKNEGHTLIDATPSVKQQPLNNQDNNTSAEEVSKEDFSGNRDISSPTYNEHFDRGNTFIDPSSNKYMDIKQRLRWDNAEAKNRAFNRQADLVFGGALYGGAGMYAAGAAAPLITTTFAPGTVGGNILGDTAGMIAIDETSKALTGRTTGQHIGDALGLAEDSNWRYATDFANPINIMGPGLLRKGISSGINYAENLSRNLVEKLNPAIDFYTSGRLKGLYDATKYGIYDRVQGLNIYRKMPSAKDIHTYNPYSETQNPGLLKFNKAKEQVSLGTATPAEIRLAESSPTGITSGIEEGGITPIVSDNQSGSRTFFGPYSYLNDSFSAYNHDPWALRSWRLGFTSRNKGFPLPKSLVEASRGAVQKAPSGSFIGADAQFLTIPQSIERVGIKRTMKQGFNNPIPDLYKHYGEDPSTFVGTKISPDAYRWFTLEAKKPGNTLVYAGRSYGFNDHSVRPMSLGKTNPETGEIEFSIINQDKAHNYYIKDLEDAYKRGEITAKQYVNKFNEWAKEFGGRPAHVDWRTGEPFIYHPIIYKKQKGGSLHKTRRNYTPSNSIKKQIIKWEGDTMKINRSFEAEARDFSKYLPQDAYDKLTQRQLDGLFSYSYNVGSSAFNSRVVPTLTKYLNGTATAEEVQKSMWAKGDSNKNNKGLRIRRAAERAMFGGHGLYRPLDTPATPPASNSKLIPKVPKELTSLDSAAPADATMVTPTVYQPTISAELTPSNKINYFKQ